MARRTALAVRSRFHRSPESTPPGFIEADPAASASELQGLMQAHGHLFFRGLVDRESVLQAREEALALCREAGWIDPSAAPLEGRWSGQAPEPGDFEPDWLAFYQRWIGQSYFNSLPEHPALISVAEKLLGDEVLCHPRKIGRVGFPQNDGHQTPAHQDFFHIRGSTETFTMWMPLGACPKRLGCLTVADGSHRVGFREHQPASGPGGWAVEADPDVVWRTNDFALGDVLVFHSLTMHKALPNTTHDELRISLDNRYQRVKDPIDEGALKPHLGLEPGAGG